MAEYLFRHYAAAAGKDWEARSCGIAAQHFFETPSGVRKSLAAYGIQDVNHTAKLVGRPNMAWATHVFAMAENHLEVLEELYPEHQAKMSLFLEGAGMGKRDVEDPIGKSDQRYKECCDLIAAGIRAIVEGTQVKT